MTSLRISTQGQIGHDRVNELWSQMQALPEKEFAARKAAGQMPYHGTSISDLGFTHYRADFERLSALLPGQQLVHAEVSPGFLSVTDEEIDEFVNSDGLDVPIKPFARDLVVFADEQYMEAFGEPLWKSMGDGQTVAEWWVLRPGCSKVWYHAVRFIRLYQILRVSDGPLWMMDVDALFNRSPKELFASIGDKDCAFRIRPGRLEPWNQFSAGIVGATKNALPYFKAIAQYLTHTKDRWFWGIDQFAMYAAYQHVQPSISFLDDKVFNLNCDPDGVVWILGGGDKFKMLEGHEFDPSTPQGRYAEKFRSYQ